jgi:hypothetical protein
MLKTGRQVLDGLPLDGRRADPPADAPGARPAGELVPGSGFGAPAAQGEAAAPPGGESAEGINTPLGHYRNEVVLARDNSEC